MSRYPSPPEQEIPEGKESCKHCYGRGYIGIHNDGTKEQCGCTKDNISVRNKAYIKQLLKRRW